MSTYAPKSTIVKVDQKTALAASTSHGALSDRRWRVRKILASYGVNTQAGTVTIPNVQGESGAAVTITRDFTGDAKDLDFGEDGLRLIPNVALVVNLTAGAAGVVGNLTTIAFPE